MRERNQRQHNHGDLHQSEDTKSGVRRDLAGMRGPPVQVIGLEDQHADRAGQPVPPLPQSIQFGAAE